MNLPPLVGLVVSSRIATLHELQTIYCLEDLHDLVEVVMVDLHNRLARRPREES